MSRLTDEDLVNIEQIREERARQRSDSSNEEKTTRAESVTGMPVIQMTDELESNMIHRDRAYISSKKSLMGIQKDDEASEEEVMQSMSGERSQSLYIRSSDCEKAELEDFKLIKVIG